MNESYRSWIVKLDSSRYSSIAAGSSPLPCITPHSAYPGRETRWGLGVIKSVIQEVSYRRTVSYRSSSGNDSEPFRSVVPFVPLPYRGTTERPTTDNLDRIQMDKSVGGVTVGMAEETEGPTLGSREDPQERQEGSLRPTSETRGHTRGPHSVHRITTRRAVD